MANDTAKSAANPSLKSLEVEKSKRPEELKMPSDPRARRRIFKVSTFHH
jgi:hypothetical protein